MKFTLKDLQELYMLKRKRQGSMFDITKLEEDFLNFSQHTSSRKLTVKLPKMYELQEDEIRQYAAALSHCGISTEVPEKVDISGAFDCNSLKDTVVFLSNNQVNADHCYRTRSYLNPLIEEIYSEGTKLIENFAIHESIAGQVSCKRGNVPVQEIKLFPEKFSPGPYTLSVELDTPTRAVKRLKELQDVLEEFEKNPKKVLDPVEVEETTKKAVGLRKLLGSLSRYSVENQKFEAETNSYVVMNGENTCFYLYSAKQNKNIIVYFGDNPLKDANASDLVVLNGDEHEKTLLKLVEAEVFEPSQAVLEQRIQDLNSLYEDACRAEGRALNENHLNFKWLREELEDVKKYFTEIINPDMRKEFAKRLKPELLEFLVYPSAENPIIHEILPRLSWNSSIREYNNTNNFISRFDKVDENGKKEMLKSVISNLSFRNYQNNDANVWLYNNYRQFSIDQGIEFELIK